MTVASLFLRIISFNMVAQGLIFTCSSMFQGLGNTKPVLWTSATRVLTYSLPAIWLSTRPGFRHGARLVHVDRGDHAPGRLSSGGCCAASSAGA